MKVNNRILIGSIGLSLMLGGCGNMNQTNANEGNEQTETTNAENQQANDRLVPVQEYTGEGYTLRNGEKTDKIAHENKEEITKAVEKFFLDEYKTEVIVHNMVGAVDGASVYVESVGEPHFYTFAIVPIDVSQKKVHTDKVWSQEGQVENAIKTALFAMVFDEEVAVLDRYIEELIKNEPLTGRTKEALERVSAAGYATPYYYTNSSGDEFNVLLEHYFKNPNISREELKSIFTPEMYSANRITFTIYLYMNEENLKPDDKLFKKIVSDIEDMEGLAKAAYSVLLNDNFIDKKSGVGYKDNSLKRATPNNIIKE